jgi:hypothetical protein
MIKYDDDKSGTLDKEEFKRFAREMKANKRKGGKVRGSEERRTAGAKRQ